MLHVTDLPNTVARCCLAGLVGHEFDTGEHYVYQLRPEENDVIIFLPRLNYLKRGQQYFRPGAVLEYTDFRALFHGTHLTREMYD